MYYGKPQKAYQRWEEVGHRTVIHTVELVNILYYLCILS